MSGCSLGAGGCVCRGQAEQGCSAARTLCKAGAPCTGCLGCLGPTPHTSPLPQQTLPRLAEVLSSRELLLRCFEAAAEVDEEA